MANRKGKEKIWQRNSGDANQIFGRDENRSRKETLVTVIFKPR